MARYFVTHYPSRPSSPWKLTIPGAVAGRRVRRFYKTEAEAWASAVGVLEMLQTGGVTALEEERKGSKGITVTGAMKLFNAQFESYSKSHREKVKKVTGWLEEAFPCALEDVTPVRCLDWFRTVKGTSTSRATVFRYARMFFNWCVKTDLIPKSPWRPVVCPESTPKRNILTSEEMGLLLKDDQMSDHLRASILLGGFAGLRTVEVLRLRWEDISSGQIYIGPEVAKQKKKGNRERLVDMTDPLKRRMEFFKNRRGLIVEVTEAEFYAERRALVLRMNEAKGVNWKTFPENSLRHSFATYHLGKSGNPGATAYQMGTSITLVINTYSVPARRANWRAWWKI